MYSFELDPATGAYAPTGIYLGRLKLGKPFPLDFALREITP